MLWVKICLLLKINLKVLCFVYSSLKKNGICSDVIINNSNFEIIEKNILVNKNDSVEKFNGSNNTLGTFILKFKTLNQMILLMDKMANYIKIKLK